MTERRNPKSIKWNLAASGVGDTDAAREAYLLVLRAVQLLMDAGADRSDAEETVARLSKGTHTAPKSLCEQRRREEKS